MGVLDDLQRCVGFEWDDGNEGKNWDKHHVSDGEYEEIFFNDPLVAGADVEDLLVLVVDITPHDYRSKS